MIKNVIAWVFLSVFLAACEQDETFCPAGPENHMVSLPLSLAPGIGVDGKTDYEPMSTKADDPIKTKIDNICYCLVLKEIESNWYVDTLLQVQLDKDKSLYGTLSIDADGPIGNIEMVLRPGHYRILAVANGSNVKWNSALIPGYPVKGETISEKEIPYAFTYLIEESPSFQNVGYRSLLKEIFTGTYQFTISKTGNLHADPINGNTAIFLTRKVSRFRILLKEGASPQYQHVFLKTDHFAKLVLKAKGDTPFCDGVNCWGNAYYNQQNPTFELPMYISTDGHWRTATQSSSSYQMVVPGRSTYPAALIFTDETKTDGILYDITLSRMTAQSPGFTYYYDETIPDHILYPNSIDGIVFQTTDVAKDIGTGYPSIRLQQVPGEDAVTLFDPFFEINH